MQILTEFHHTKDIEFSWKSSTTLKTDSDWEKLCRKLFFQKLWFHTNNRKQTTGSKNIPAVNVSMTRTSFFVTLHWIDIIHHFKPWCHLMNFLKLQYGTNTVQSQKYYTIYNHEYSTITKTDWFKYDMRKSQKLEETEYLRHNFQRTCGGGTIRGIIGLLDFLII